jgi:O-methyltransferase
MMRLFYAALRKAHALQARLEDEATYRKFRAYTMVSRSAYIANLELARRHSSISGSVVECGTWRGGMIAGIAQLLGPHRSYYLFDSFEGLPPAQEIDGESALRWQADTQSPRYYDNCRAAEQDARNAMALAGVRNATITKGWFRNTLPQAEFLGGIALLRLDADWYESTRDILVNSFQHVNRGGVIIVDDYYAWDGCAKALHEFLSERQRAERICVHSEVCFVVKR